MKAQLIRPFRVLTMIKAPMDRVLRERPGWTASSRVGFTGFTPKFGGQGGTKAGTGREEVRGYSLEAMGIVEFAKDNGCPLARGFRLEARGQK